MASSIASGFFRTFQTPLRTFSGPLRDDARYRRRFDAFRPRGTAGELSRESHMTAQTNDASTADTISQHGKIATQNDMSSFVAAVVAP
jgi:hypothetical protein